MFSRRSALIKHIAEQIKRIQNNIGGREAKNKENENSLEQKHYEANLFGNIN